MYIYKSFEDYKTFIQEEVTLSYLLPNKGNTILPWFGPIINDTTPSYCKSFSKMAFIRNFQIMLISKSCQVIISISKSCQVIISISKCCQVIISISKCCQVIISISKCCQVIISISKSCQFPNLVRCMKTVSGASLPYHLLDILSTSPSIHTYASLIEKKSAAGF